MTQHDIYDEYKGLRLWSYLTCEKDADGRETWRIRVEVKCIDELSFLLWMVTVPTLIAGWRSWRAVNWAPSWSTRAALPEDLPSASP